MDQTMMTPPCPLKLLKRDGCGHGAPFWFVVFQGVDEAKPVGDGVAFGASEGLGWVGWW
jgi:hypothetical protein